MGKKKEGGGEKGKILRKKEREERCPEGKKRSDGGTEGGAQGRIKQKRGAKRGRQTCKSNRKKAIKRKNASQGDGGNTGKKKNAEKDRGRRRIKKKQILRGTQKRPFGMEEEDNDTTPKRRTTRQGRGENLY